MSPLFTSAPRIDTSSRRWTVAVHEAAHVVAVRHLGWTVRYARISADGDSGEMDDRPPRGVEQDVLRVQSAVISLVGPRASARQRWFLPAGCQHDARDARHALAGTGVTYAAANGQARRLVDAHWPQIQRIARQLYRDGQL